jgi:hypothetical protein
VAIAPDRLAPARCACVRSRDRRAHRRHSTAADARSRCA